MTVKQGLYLLVAGISLPVLGAADPFVHVIDLETADLKTGPGGSFTRTGSVVDMVLEPWDGKDIARKWPCVHFPLPRDCRGYDFLEYGMFTVKGTRFSFSIDTVDMKEFGEHKAADIDPVQMPTYVFDMTQYAPEELAKMSHFSIYQSGPSEQTKFQFRSARLVSKLPERASALASAMRRIGLPVEQVESLPDFVRKGQLTLREADTRLREAASEFTVNRLADIRHRSALAHPGTAFAVFALDCVEKLRPTGNSLFEPFGIGHWELELAKREREGMQVFVLAPTNAALKDVSISAGAFVDDAGHRLPEPVAAPVGRVTVTSTKGPPSSAGEHFDPICEFTNAVGTVAAGHLQAFHVRFRADADTPAGIYRGRVCVRAKGSVPANVEVAVRVRDVTLPVRTTLRTATAIYGSKLMGSNGRRFRDWVLDEYRVNPLNIYVASVQSPKEYPEMVKRGLSYIPIIYINSPDDSHFNRRGKVKGFKTARQYWLTLSEEERSHYPPEETEYIMESLAKAVPELKAAGLYEYAACYAFDEFRGYSIPAIAELCQKIKDVYPDLKISSTASPSPDPRLRGMIDHWIAPISAYDPKLAARFRSDYGNEVWYYTIYMTVDMDTLATIRSELGMRAFAQRTDGWLVWCMTRWNNNPNPIVTAEATGWNVESFPGLNGGGSYFCMGPNGCFLPTLRAEAIRDGLEDHCLLTMVERCPEAKRLLGELPTTRTCFSATDLRRIRHEALEVLEAAR